MGDFNIFSPNKKNNETENQYGYQSTWRTQLTEILLLRMSPEHTSLSNAPRAFTKIDHQVSKKSERADSSRSIFSDHSERNRLYFPKMAATLFLFQGFSRTLAFPIKGRTLNLEGLCGCFKDGSPVDPTPGDTQGGHHFWWALSQKGLARKTGQDAARKLRAHSGVLGRCPTLRAPSGCPIRR